MPRPAPPEQPEPPAPSEQPEPRPHPVAPAKVAPGPAVLEVEDVSVRFKGLVAVSQASLRVREGIVTALIGPNGAGKTTLFNAIMGVVRLEEGRVSLGGTDITALPSHLRARLGLARTFQNLQLVEGATVLENLIVGSGPIMRAGPVEALLRLPRARAQDETFAELARRAAALVGVPSTTILAGELPGGIRRRLEVARGLMSRPKVLLLDEPAAGLDLAETRDLGRLIARIRDELGAAVLVVEHDMSLVRDFADYVFVMDFGRLIAEGTPAEVLRDEAVITAYLGQHSAHA